VFGTIFSNRLASELHARTPFLTAYTDSLSTVFVVAAAVAAVGFALIWLLPEAELRETVAASRADGAISPPRSPDSLAEIEHGLWLLANRDTKRQIYAGLTARAGIDLTPAAAWALGRLNEEPGLPADELAERRHLSPDRIADAYDLLGDHGLIDNLLQVTPAGDEVIDRLFTARRESLSEYLTAWKPHENPDLRELLDRVSRDLPPVAV
jgi:hypothetical protein